MDFGIVRSFSTSIQLRYLLLIVEEDSSIVLF